MLNGDPFEWLFGLAQFGIKFGLENIRAIVAALDHPEQAFRSIHIAGTNGKGSVTAMVDAALRSAGVRTGRYTSPHLLDLSERFAIDGVPSAREELARAVDTVHTVVERLRDDAVLETHPTFFEVTTAVAFELFRDHGVEVAVCEVGLGGRLDATNVLSPVACAITSIGLDHQQYLGSTLSAIAAEKAGIIKAGTPVVVGRVPPDAQTVIAARARQVDAPVLWAAVGLEVGTATELPDGRQRFGLRTPSTDYGDIVLALAGAHQVHNAAVAVRLLEAVQQIGIEVTREAIVRGLAEVRWPGRLETIRLRNGRELLLDAAHNEQGAAALAEYLSRHTPAKPLVFAAMRDKDIEQIVRALVPHVSFIALTRASNPRSADPSEIRAIVKRVAPGLAVDVAGSPADALARAWSFGQSVVVAGSIFLLADVMRELGRP